MAWVVFFPRRAGSQFKAAVCEQHTKRLGQKVGIFSLPFPFPASDIILVHVLAHDFFFQYWFSFLFFIFPFSISTCLCFLLLPFFIKKGRKKVLLTSSFQNSSCMYASEEGEASRLSLASVICSMHSWKSSLSEAGKSSVLASPSRNTMRKEEFQKRNQARNNAFSVGSCLVLGLKIKKLRQ